MSYLTIVRQLDSAPLPSHTEILDQESGEWRRLNDIELDVANSAGFYQIDGLHWHHCWSSMWAKLRIPKQETA